MNKLKWVAFFLLVFLLSCTQPSTENSQARSGNLAVYLTDLPAGVEKILVTISAIDVHKTGGAFFTVFSREREYDLLELQDNPELLFDVKLEEGKYTQIRLQVTEGRIQISGVLYPLTVPSSEVKINRNFSVLSGGTTRIILDFDADKSLKVSGNPKNNKYNLRPVILVKNISY
ncbi:MAG TPA: DUF4382 domain-containing protein [Patescibacteria group bacterium]|nr:DUF4382 domain-containing protein [Patescibacteria group bacterium]